MRKAWVVARREFVEKVRTRWFIVSTILGPLLMTAMIFLPIVFATRGGGERSIVVVDATTTRFGARVTEMLRPPLPVRAERLPAAAGGLGSVTDSLARAVGEKRIDGFLVVSDATVTDGAAEYRGSNVSSQVDVAVLARVLREAVLMERLEEVGVDPDLVARAQVPVQLHTVGIRGGRETEQSGESTFFLAYMIWFVLYFAILVYGIQVAGSVVEEKSSRVVEVLISSLRPFELLAGKVVGVGAVGLFQLSLWAGFGWLLLEQRERLAALFDVGATGPFRLPGVPIETLAIFVTYFLFGYLVYAAMFAAVGAMSSTEAEARQAQQPVVMLLVIPAVMMPAILQRPDGTLAVVLSLVPFTSPIAMPVRWAAAAVPPAELWASIALLAAALWVVTWVAARIYRVGILMYGKRPSPRELVRWIASR